MGCGASTNPSRTFHKSGFEAKSAAEDPRFGFDAAHSFRLKWHGEWIVEDSEISRELDNVLRVVKPSVSLNRTILPERWGITVRQFNHFVCMCRRKTVTWQSLAASTSFEKSAGVVNGYQLCESFVKPFSRGTGCGVALLYNGPAPLQSHVMISHTWAEDILEMEAAINDFADRDSCGKDLVIWCCILANYQCGDEVGDTGPTVTEQLKMDPFGRVIRSPGLTCMCLVITSEQDPYDRLWCVYELNTALMVQDQLREKRSERADTFINIEWSEKALIAYSKRIDDWARKQAKSEGRIVEEWEAMQEFGSEYAYYMCAQDCEKASCSREEDADMIRSEVMKQGGWEALNSRMAKFRIPAKARDEAAAAATSEQARLAERVDEIFQSYNLFFEHIGIRKGWRTAPFEREQVQPLFYIAAEIVASIRTRLDKEGQKGIVLRQLEGSSMDFLWGWNPERCPCSSREVEKEFVRGLVLATLSDRHGPVEGLDTTSIDECLRCHELFVPSSMEVADTADAVGEPGINVLPNPD